jgi:hypothetical protein
MQAHTLPLEANEIHSLNVELRNYYITSVCASILVIAFIHALFYTKFGQFTFPKYEPIVLTAMIALAGFISNKMIKPLRNEIQTGNKIIEYLIVESKYDFNDKDNKDSSPYTKYVIVANGKKFVVPEVEYKKAEFSDYLAIHRSPIRGKIIKIEIL